ncbi:aminopeptidase P N-terminal domain-containing protein [Puia sp. P3]|uniref:aminopeptidase P N-terminal domain-containing protein n=1 Tax=Puia sp. P3 TaxID=3423952 RepID=UPI003D673C3E
MRYFPILPELFSANRSRFVQAMEPGSIAIFVSNDEMPSNGDAHYSFRQNSDLFWLSGITQEDSMVVLFPDHPDTRYREVLVLVRPNELKEKWDEHAGCGLRRQRRFPASARWSGWTLWMGCCSSGCTRRIPFTSTPTRTIVKAGR